VKVVFGNASFINDGTISIKILVPLLTPDFPQCMEISVKKSCLAIDAAYYMQIWPKTNRTAPKRVLTIKKEMSTEALLPGVLVFPRLARSLRKFTKFDTAAT